LDLPWRYGLKNIFFRNKTFLFFKIESWNFQYLFEIEFHETSQNFNSFSWFRQLLFSFFLWVVCLSWNFVRLHEILFQTNSENFRFLSWKTKALFLKKFFFKLLSISKQKNFVDWLNFPGRFWYSPMRLCTSLHICSFSRRKPSGA
jgi:hypothetical protein